VFKWIGGLIDRICAVSGALIFSQIPLYMQDYQQRLSGHLAELQSQVQGMRQAAALSGKSLQQYVAKFQSSPDIDFKNQGALMHEMIQRFQQLNEGHQALLNSTVYSKPLMFFKYIDAKIAKSTWASFEWGLNLTVDGFLYALLGIVCGLMVYGMLSKLFRMVFVGSKALQKS